MEDIRLLGQIPAIYGEQGAMYHMNIIWSFLDLLCSSFIYWMQLLYLNSWQAQLLAANLAVEQC